MRSGAQYHIMREIIYLVCRATRPSIWLGKFNLSTWTLRKSPLGYMQFFILIYQTWTNVIGNWPQPFVKQTTRRIRLPGVWIGYCYKGQWWEEPFTESSACLRVGAQDRISYISNFPHKETLNDSVLSISNPRLSLDDILRHTVKHLV